MIDEIIGGIENITDLSFQNDLFFNEYIYPFTDIPYDFTEISPEISDRLVDIGYSPVEKTYYDELDNFTSESYENMEGIVGYPEASLEHWECQEGNTCALHAQRMIIEEVTGAEIDINDMQAVAEAYGWFDNGTPPDCMNKMLDYCGIPNEKMNCTGGYEQLREMLASGDKVIAGVDADEYWYGEYDDVFNPDCANHAVEIIGIDESDPENPMIILNDTGIPNGCGVRVPADCFMDAWEDSGYSCTRVPVNIVNDAGMDSLSDSYENGGGEKLGYSADYYQDEMKKALNNGNSIAYDNARRHWADAVVKEQTK